MVLLPLLFSADLIEDHSEGDVGDTISDSRMLIDVVFKIMSQLNRVRKVRFL